MTPTPTSSHESATHLRVVEAATRLFAENGFEKTTIRQICDEAGVNIASVNYHFGDKEALYFAVLVNAHREAKQRAVPDEVPRDVPPEEQLRLFVWQFLSRVFDPQVCGVMGRLMAQEMMQPTKALDHLVAEEIRPKSIRLREIVIAVAGCPIPEQDLRRLAYSIVGQCLFYRHAAPLVQRLTPDLRFDHAELEQLTNHITRFSLAGIHQTIHSLGKDH